MIKHIFSLHKITANSSVAYDNMNFTFSRKDYSKFKFGDKDVARKFGYDLARVFMASFVFQKIIKAGHKNFVILSSPYCFIPTATKAMVDYFVQFFNQHMADMGYPVAEILQIHRTITYKEDYGELSAEQRLALIEKDGFHIDKEFLKDKFLIFIDDIKITGSHEKVIERMINENSISNDHLFMYFAALHDDTINPKIENYLNYFYVKNLRDLDKIIKNKTFLPNTRVVKYILNCKDELEFTTFCQYQSKKTLTNLYHLAIGNSYHLIPDYMGNLNHIKQILIQRNCLLE